MEDQKGDLPETMALASGQSWDVKPDLICLEVPDHQWPGLLPQKQPSLGNASSILIA